MTSGFDWNEDIPYNDPRNDEIRMTRDPQPLRYALARPFVNDPGTDFKYNGGLTQVVAAVLVRATKSRFRNMREQNSSNRWASQMSNGLEISLACLQQLPDSGCARVILPRLVLYI